MKGLSKAQSSLESESGAHIQIPGVADYPTQSTTEQQNQGERRGSLKVLLGSEKEGTVFPEMNNAGRGGWGGGSSSWAPSLFLARLQQSRKPPS